MQFHPTGTDPTPEALLVCRNARWNVATLLVIFWAIPVFWWFVSAPQWVLYLCAALALLLTGPMVATWRKRGRADNWVLALYGHGLWLNLRDCEYSEAEPAETVLFVPYQEISSARRIIHRYTTPSSDGGSTTSHKDIYLELQLSADHSGAIKKALAEERHRDPPLRSFLGGFITSQRRRTESPLEAAGDAAVRIKFRVSGYGLRPTIKKVLAELNRFVRVEGDEQQKTPDWHKLDQIQFDTLVDRLVAGGQRIDAIRLIRERKGLSLATARKFIAELEKHERQPPHQ